MTTKMIKKTFKTTFSLIFQSEITINNTTYRLPYFIFFLKAFLNFVYFFGGFLLMGGSISMFLQSLNIKPNLWVVVPLTILFHY